MSKLEELKNLVADAFKAAETKETIETAALLNKKMEEVEAEQKELMDRNKELLDSYKDVVLHTAAKPASGDGANNPVGGAQSFDEMLGEFLASHDENGVAK